MGHRHYLTTNTIIIITTIIITTIIIIITIIMKTTTTTIIIITNIIAKQQRWKGGGGGGRREQDEMVPATVGLTLVVTELRLESVGLLTAAPTAVPALGGSASTLWSPWARSIATRAALAASGMSAGLACSTASISLSRGGRLGASISAIGGAVVCGAAAAPFPESSLTSFAASALGA